MQEKCCKQSCTTHNAYAPALLKRCSASRDGPPARRAAVASTMARRTAWTSTRHLAEPRCSRSVVEPPLWKTMLHAEVVNRTSVPPQVLAKRERARHAELQSSTPVLPAYMNPDVRGTVLAEHRGHELQLLGLLPQPIPIEGRRGSVLHTDF